MRLDTHLAEKSNTTKCLNRFVLHPRPAAYPVAWEGLTERLIPSLKSAATVENFDSIDPTAKQSNRPMKNLKLVAVITFLSLCSLARAEAQELGKKEPAASVFKNVGVDEFEKLAADKKNIVLDVRTASEFAGGHISGAANLDVNSPDFEKQAAALDKSKVYLVHCAAGVRSVKACQKLTQLQFPHLYNLTPGFKGWVKAGKPVEKK